MGRELGHNRTQVLRWPSESRAAILALASWIALLMQFFSPTSQPSSLSSGSTVAAWIVWLARLGFAAKGVVYLVLGLLTVQAALGIGGKTTDQIGVLRSIGQQPFGRLLLGIMAIGFSGYALWQVVKVFCDPSYGRVNLRSLLLRGGSLISGLIYGGLAVTTVRLLSGLGSLSSEQRAEWWTARLLFQPYGGWLVVLAGLVIIGLGLYQFYKVRRATFLGELRLETMHQSARQWATRSGRLGHAALGIVMLICGGFLIQAAIDFDPDEAGGVQQALQALAQHAYSSWLLVAVAAGLIAYGLFTFLLACYANYLFAPTLGEG